jgi:hypothetical protein
LFRWYWWNCWPSLFKFSFHNLFTWPQSSIVQHYKTVHVTNQIVGVTNQRSRVS